MLRSIWKPLVRAAVTGRLRRFELRPTQPAMPTGLRRLGLYLHVPFCRNLCPYCPYNGEEYTGEHWELYERAVLQEIAIYADALRLDEVPSLYIGGGTPTVNPDGLGRILRGLLSRFPRPAEMCVELHPSNMDAACLHLLHGLGVSKVSVGVESLSDRLLAAIGRSHDGAAALDGVRRALAMGFTVNADLMFALPTQTPEELAADLDQLLAAGVHQLSTYPMFGFPYSELGRNLGLRDIRRPDGRRIRAMLRLIAGKCQAAGMKRCAVWSFLAPGRSKFSSITRHHYLGFGPSAGSMTGTHFWVNTFSVAAYAEALPARRPVALCLEMSPDLERVYWLYWRTYEMHVARSDYAGLFGGGLERRFGYLLTLGRLAGMIERCPDGYRINDRGAYWIHRLQNEFSLEYINRLWGRCRQEPWPAGVRL